jgi:hypothetical protein
MSSIKNNKNPIIIAITQWFITTVFQVDRFFFTYDYENYVFLIVKAIYLVFLIVSWCFLFNVYKKVKAENEIYKRGLQVFFCYFSLMMLLLLILWPGTWAWDDIWILNSLQWYNGFSPIQHVITGLYQDVMLQILPFPGGIVLLQNLIISICVAFSVTKLENSYNIIKLKNCYLDILAKIVPFLLPPVLMYQFSGYRIGLYIYLELVMLVILICAIRDKQQWNWIYTLLFCFLCVIVGTWRTESFFYIPFSCLLLLFVDNNTIFKIKKIVCMILLILGYLGMNFWQNRSLGNTNYEIISILRPCAELVRAADNLVDADVLNEIDKVVSLEVIRNNPNTNGEILYFNTDVVQVDYTKEDYNDFLKAFIKLSFKYPKIVITERWNLFLKGSGITGSTTINVQNAATLFDTLNVNRPVEATMNNRWIVNTPVFKTMRKGFINVLGGNKIDGTVFWVMQRVIWNAIIPLVLLIYAWVKLLIKRQWYLWAVSTAVLIRVFVVVLTQPSNWFMYMLSFYFLGYVFLVYKMLLFAGIRGRKN